MGLDESVFWALFWGIWGLVGFGFLRTLFIIRRGGEEGATVRCQLLHGFCHKQLEKIPTRRHLLFWSHYHWRCGKCGREWTGPPPGD